MRFEVISLPQVAVGFAVGAAPVAAGLGLAFAAYKLSEHLKSEYQAALSEFKMREAEAEAHHKQAEVKYMRASIEAQTLASVLAAEGASTSQVFAAASLEDISAVAEQS